MPAYIAPGDISSTPELARFGNHADLVCSVRRYREFLYHETRDHVVSFCFVHFVPFFPLKPFPTVLEKFSAGVRVQLISISCRSRYHFDRNYHSHAHGNSLGAGPDRSVPIHVALSARVPMSSLVRIFGCVVPSVASVRFALLGCANAFHM